MAVAPVTVAPMDEHNQSLVANAHPPDWANPEPQPMYNMVVIGAGTAGLVTAIGAAGLGAKVALIERHLMGGDCLNVGCVPSKCVIASSRVAAAARHAADFGVNVPNVDVDFPAVMARMRKLRAGISEVDSARRFTENGVDVFLGEGTFTSANTIQVGGKTLRFKRATIATGARAAVPPIPGLAEGGYLTNDTVFSLTECPRRLAVIGSGPIGCELAQAFQRLGAAVTVVEKGSQILPREDRDAAAIVQRQLDCDGVQFHFHCETNRVDAAGDEKRLHLSADGNDQVLAVDAILVAVGRQPNLEGLGLDDVGIAYDPRKGVTVNDYLQTSVPHIYAAGDVCMDWKFTHAADFAARKVIQNALFSVGPIGKSKLSALTMPWCTYTEPEIAHVGLSEHDAKERNIAIDTFVQSFEEVDRAILEGEREGFVKIHTQKGSDKVLGATIVAANAGDMISEITVAIVNGVGLKGIANAIHPYPTQADAIRKVGDQYNRSRLTPRVKQAFNRWMAWKRKGARA